VDTERGQSLSSETNDDMNVIKAWIVLDVVDRKQSEVSSDQAVEGFRVTD
jgi:hypothetical protein